MAFSKKELNAAAILYVAALPTLLDGSESLWTVKKRNESKSFKGCNRTRQIKVDRERV
jgi:hypothetical protein